MAETAAAPTGGRALFVRQSSGLVRIEMTDPGRTAAGAIDAAIAAIERRAIADLPAEARSGLQAALERFAEATV
ncbi:MAG TPA: hypothetical protein VHJ18_16560 [Streptosporangiaceae bacterium]|jgi:hypothetical protein|nr:hypothetical protein [Streptosporangiaceae bacterium]